MEQCVECRVSEQEVSLSVIIGSCTAIIDTPASARPPSGRLDHDTHIARSLLMYEVGGVNIVIMSLVLSVETVRSADYYP